MIAIDTNVLLRYLLADDAVQHAKAKSLIKNKCPVLIADVVLAETVWTLTGKRYNLDKAAVCVVVRGLISDGAFIFENSRVIWSALRDYEEAKSVRDKELDFADSLIANKSHSVAEDIGASLSAFYCFDKAVTQLKNARSL